MKIVSEGSTFSVRQRFSEALRQHMATQWNAPSSPRYSFVSVPLETGISLPGQKRDCTPQGTEEFIFSVKAELFKLK